MVVVAGFLVLAAGGAIARFGIGNALNTADWPLGTFAVNIIGAFALGLIAAQGNTTLLLVGTAGLGSLTTFSTLAYESVVMSEDNRRTAAMLYLTATLIVGCAAAYLGLEWGS